MKSILTLVFVMSALTVFSQEKFYEFLAEEACSCIAEKNLDNMTQEELNMELGFCIMAGMGKYDGEDAQEVDMTDMTAMYDLGEKVGMKMAVKCPDKLMAVVGGTMEEEIEAETLKIDGVIKAVSGEDFSYVVVEKDGRSQKFLWLRYFKGSEVLSEDPDGMVGKKVTIYYQNIECYSPKLRDYIIQKEITELTIDQ